MNHPAVFASIVVSVLIFSTHATPAAQAPPLLISADWKCSLATGGPIEFLRGSAVVARMSDPMTVESIDRMGTISRLSGTYAAIKSDARQCRASGSLTTAAGSIFDFIDIFTAGPGDEDFSLDRTVTIRHANAPDAGFRSLFEVCMTDAQHLSDVEPFIPGTWYCDAAHVSASGLITNPAQHNYLIREDRLPLPLVMIRQRSTGLTISLTHGHPDGSTFPAENTAETVIDARMRFASLGVVQENGIGLAIAYPGVEEDHSRMAGGKNDFQPSQRFHPVLQGFTQHYHVIVHLSLQPTFDDALSDAWRSGYDVLRPQIVSLPINRVYADSIDLLNHYCEARHGVMGFPFAVKLPGGEVRDVSYQMGFVGEQLPCAYHLITAGFARPQPDLVEKGSRITDFWAANCLTPAGIPRTWYDLDPTPHWRTYKTYTRIATDGMEGMLQVWRRMKLNHRDKPEWLACCRTYGDWLVANQNADGSYFRQYDDAGQPSIASKSAALQPVRFLIDLWNATADDRYLQAAKRAGTFAINDIGATANYYGGTADNKDVKDKEAGWIALDSFLSLYEATGDRTWLAPATRAATFTETWTYCWNVPIDRSDPAVTFPPVQTTAGMSLIATGQSASDVFLAFAPYAYYRLALYTGDAHFAAVAHLLMQNPRQLVDIDGSLHYARTGLLTEAFTFAPPRGHGVNVWLPWCTAAVLEPMQQFQDAFGAMDLKQIDAIPIECRRQLLEAFGRHHGFPNVPTTQH